MEYTDIVRVEDVLVRPEVISTNFACDLGKCKGACCTLDSPFGAPLEENEVKTIRDILPQVMKYMPEEHVKIVEFSGFYEVISGEYMTRTVDKKSCVFVYFENGIARCSIERAYFSGEVDFRKPLSCHLFPIRISVFGGHVLRYEKFGECEPALENGRINNLTIAEFCKDALIRAYGHNWYSSFMKKIGK